MTGRLHPRRRRCARFSCCDAGRDVDGCGACMRPPRSIAAAVESDDMCSACAACSSRRTLCFSPGCHRYDELRCSRSRCSVSCVCGCDSSVRPRISAVFFSSENCRAVTRARRSDVARRLARAHRGLAGETAAQLDEQVLFAAASIRRAGDGLLQSMPATRDLLFRYRSDPPTSRLCLLSTLMCLSARRRCRRRQPCATHQQKRCSTAHACASRACRLHRR